MNRSTFLLSSFIVLFAASWTAWMLPRNNIERQGGDIVHHALIVQELIDPSLPAPAFFKSYPRLSHQIAAGLSILFDADPIQGMRCVALVALGLMTLFQFELLRSALSWSAAAITLCAWQFVCTTAKVGNINHFLWEGQYNYSRAVGAAAMWLSVLVLAVTRRRQSQGLLFSWLAAIFAIQCHLVPGVLAFGTIVLHYSLHSHISRSWRPLQSAGLSGVVAVVSCLTSKSREMAGIAAAGGWLPVALEPLLWIWAPTALLAIGCIVGLRRRSQTELHAVDSSDQVLIAACLTSAALQSALFVGRFVGRISDYSYNSALFYTFQFASLWLIHAAATGLCHWRPDWRIDRYPLAVRRGCQLAAVVAGIFAIGVALKRDVRRPYFGEDRDPVHVVRQLHLWSDRIPTILYIDPEQPMSSYFVNLSIANLDAIAAMKVSDQIRDGFNINKLCADREVHALVLPRAFNPSQTLRSNVDAEARGNFWLVRLPDCPRTTLAPSAARR